ncbi:MAG: peptidylprolyl isomerase [Arcobacteraceae bacterium]|nr:peptidylprolyl isomerase [Arcobacteraceae bacterium]
MIKSLLKFGIALSCASTLALGANILAVVDGKNITDEVAPKDYQTMDKEMQLKIVNRLVEKRLASDYALSTDISKSDKFARTLEHVLFMNSDDSHQKQSGFLAEIMKDDGKIEGYTQEQLYSKKGLLAFDFLVNEQAETIKITKKQLTDYYELNKYKYDTPAMKELLVIVVDTKKIAADIVSKLKKSENARIEFQELAKEFSKAPSANENGYFGKIPTAEMNDLLKPILKDMKVATFTGPIKTEFGYQVFYILNDIPEFKSKFTQVRSKINEEMMQKAVKQWAVDTISELKNKAKIKIIN